MEKKEETLPDLKFNTSTNKLDISALLIKVNKLQWTKENITYEENKEIQYDTFPALPLCGDNYAVAISPDESKIGVLRLWKYTSMKALQVFIVDQNKKTYFESPHIFSVCKDAKLLNRIAISSDGLCAFITENNNTDVYHLLISDIKTKKKQWITTSLQKHFDAPKKGLAFNAAGTHIALRIVKPNHDETEIHVIDNKLKE